MRVTKEQAAENRKAVLAAAGRLFRERGFDAVSVADLMSEAGFTHGGFYNHFASKEALAREVVEAGLLGSIAQAPGGPLAGGLSLPAYVAMYLSPEHRDRRAQGCAMAALAADTARQGEELQTSFAEGVAAFVGAVEKQLLAEACAKGKRAKAEAEVEARTQALRLVSEMVGALILSRAVAADAELSDALLEASRGACESAGSERGR